MDEKPAIIGEYAVEIDGKKVQWQHLVKRQP